jgi:hypothetical protein
MAIDDSTAETYPRELVPNEVVTMNPLRGIHTLHSKLLAQLRRRNHRPSFFSAIMFGWAIFLACGLNRVEATSFQLEFIPISRDDADAIVPKISSQFSTGRFSLGGIRSSVSEIKIIRIEDTKDCEEGLCPTVVSHSTSEWKILIKAYKYIIVDNPNSDYLQITFKEKSGETIFRFTSEMKLVYIAR